MPEALDFECAGHVAQRRWGELRGYLPVHRVRLEVIPRVVALL